MISTPLFSVVIPAWKRPSLTRRAVESVLAQAFTSFEVLVVDDASPEPIEAAIGLPPDDRIRHLRRSVNGGGSAARNTGIDAALGEYVAFLDSDDVWLPEKLTREAAWIAQWRGGSSWLLFSRYWIEGPNGRTPSKAAPWGPDKDLASFLFVERGNIQTSSLVMPAALARRVRFDEDLRRLQDWDFLLRASAAGASIQHLPEFTAVYDAPDDPERVSLRLDPDFLQRWVELRRGWMSARAYHGFLANKVAPELVQAGRRTEALPLLLQGLLHGVVPARNGAIELVRLATSKRTFDRLLAVRKSVRDLRRAKDQ